VLNDHEASFKGTPMKLHTRMLTIFADDIAALNVGAITIRLDTYSGFNSDDFDELKAIMADRHPQIRLRMA
jgi:hypothetical protein